jgi:alpha-L-rhamnosidase
MNSFAHYSFGAVYQWMVENIGGIRTEGPAYKRIRIAPQPGGRLKWAQVSYRSIRGLIDSAWKRDGDRFVLEVTIPANTRATVCIPAHAASAVTEGGRSIDETEGVQFLRMEGDKVLLEVGSGEYRFESVWPGEA